MPGRPRTGIGTFGSISTVANGSKAFTASTRVRDCDGRLRRVTALGSTKASAVAALKAMLTARDEAGAAGETVTADMPFVALAQLWLEDIKIDPRLSDGTKAVYESELRTLVLPTFAHFTLREVSTARVERFLTAQSVKSYAKAKHSKVILNLLMRYAQRHDAIRHNPVDGTSALKRPPVAPKALTMDDLQAIRHSARTWRSGGSYPGPKPDGQLGDLIEVMLGTSARIGEALAIRKCDGDVPSNPPIVHICGTIVVRTGKGTSRQPWTKTSTSDRTVAIPQFAAEVIRKRLSAVDGREPEHLLFFTKYGTPITPYNARRTFRQVLEHAGLADRGITPRSFRKTVATLISQDADAETAAEMLGHSGTQITKKHYIERSNAPNPATAAILDKLAPPVTDS